MLWEHRRETAQPQEFKARCLEKKRTLMLTIGGGKGGMRDTGREFQVEETAVPPNMCVSSSGPLPCIAGKAIPNIHLAESDFDFHPGF